MQVHRRRGRGGWCLALWRDDSTPPDALAKKVVEIVIIIVIVFEIEQRARVKLVEQVAEPTPVNGVSDDVGHQCPAELRSALQHGVLRHFASKLLKRDGAQLAIA